jgi:hypothetical protein
MQRVARQHHHPAGAPLLVLALVVALGAAMCVRVHRAIAHPPASVAQPSSAASPAALTRPPVSPARR